MQLLPAFKQRRIVAAGKHIAGLDMQTPCDIPVVHSTRVQMYVCTFRDIRTCRTIAVYRSKAQLLHRRSVMHLVPNFAQLCFTTRAYGMWKHQHVTLDIVSRDEMKICFAFSRNSCEMRLVFRAEK